MANDPLPSEKVEREKRYETDVRSNSGCDELPTKAQFALSEVAALEILRLSSLCIRNGLYKVEKFDYRASWLEVDDSDALLEVRTDAGVLNVSVNDFWFSAYLKHTDVEVLTEPQSISELKEWFGIKDVTKDAIATNPRVLVIVGGGVAVPIYDEGVDVVVFDWDNYNDDPVGTGGVPVHFADLAEQTGIPVEEDGDKYATPSGG